MEEVIILPPGVAFSVIAFLLSLLPAGLFIWMWYLRRSDRPVPVSTVALTFAMGIALVAPAFYLESQASNLWHRFWPDTAHYFLGPILPLQTWQDILLPAFGTFLVVALVEEGLRYGLLRWWLKRSAQVDQVFDGLVLGVAAGLGFATLENTLYFLNLFNEGSFDTLVFVFFLRFVMSTLAHIMFGGLMGTFIARGLFSMYAPGRYYQLAFFVPWIAHGLYDLLLGFNLSVYAVFLLLPPLGVLITWSGRREFLVVSRKNGHFLLFEEAPESRRKQTLNQFLQQFDSPWNVYAPWLKERRHRGTLLTKLKSP